MKWILPGSIIIMAAVSVSAAETTGSIRVFVNEQQATYLIQHLDFLFKPPLEGQGAAVFEDVEFGNLEMAWKATASRLSRFGTGIAGLNENHSERRS